MKLYRWLVLGVPVLVLGYAGLRMTLLNTPEKVPAAWPQLAMYSSVHGNGSPYMRDSIYVENPGFYPSVSHYIMVLDSAVIASQARWDYVTLDVTGQSVIRPIVQALRAANPRIKIFGFLLGHCYWVNPEPDTLPGDNFPWHYWQAVRNTGGILYDTLGNPGPNMANVNLASRRTMEALADTVIAEAVKPGLFDGLFIDVNCLSVANGYVDYKRAGFRSMAAFDSSWKVNHQAFVDRIRVHAKPGFMLMGNCGPQAEHDHWNGWMRENFPLQNGGTWASNMLPDISEGGPGYLADDSLYVQPSLCWISEMPDAQSAWDSPENLRRVRFGLGSATLAGGVFTYVWTPNDHLRGYTPWWYPEYDGAGRGKGWLGQPTGRAVQFSDGTWRRDFTNGAVIVNPTPRAVYWFGDAGSRTLDGRLSSWIGPNDALFIVKVKP